jgi:hypothetical protein
MVAAGELSYLGIGVGGWEERCLLRKRPKECCRMMRRRRVAVEVPGNRVRDKTRSNA